MALPARVHELLQAVGEGDSFEDRIGDHRRRYAVEQRDDADHAALTKLRTGDVAAFETLFTAYAARLCDYAYRYLQSRDDAREIVQQLFLRLWRRRTELEIPGAVGAYLYAAVRNMARNKLRDESVQLRWREVVERDGDASGYGNTGTTPHEMLERAERHAVISHALSELPDRRREVCILRWVEGLSYAEISHRLGISQKTVDAQLRRAIRAIRERLADRVDE